MWLTSIPWLFRECCAFSATNRPWASTGNDSFSKDSFRLLYSNTPNILQYSNYPMYSTKWNWLAVTPCRSSSLTDSIDGTTPLSRTRGENRKWHLFSLSRMHVISVVPYYICGHHILARSSNRYIISNRIFRIRVTFFKYDQLVLRAFVAGRWGFRTSWNVSSQIRPAGSRHQRYSNSHHFWWLKLRYSDIMIPIEESNQSEASTFPTLATEAKENGQPTVQSLLSPSTPPIALRLSLVSIIKSPTDLGTLAIILYIVR